VAEQAALNERDRAVRAEQQAAAQQRLAEDARNQALDASRRADVEAATATAVRQFLGDDLLAQASSTTQAGARVSPDPDLKVRDALDRAAARIGTRFTSQPLVEAAIRQTIGMTYLQMGLHREAAPQLEQALALRTRTLGPRHVDTLTSMGDLGYIYMRLGQTERARTLFNESYEGLRAVLGENDQRTMTVLGNSAANAPRPEREAIWARLLPVQRRLLGDEHPETLALMHNLGVSNTDAGRYADAESLYVRVVSVKKRILGDDHPSTLISIHALGVNHRFLGKYPEAEKILASAYEIRRRTLGEEHPETLVTMNGLALVYGAQGRYLEAESLLQRALDARRRVLGEVHQTTIGTLNSLAELYRKQRRLAEAQPLFERVLEVRRRDLGPEDRNTANTLTSLGELTLAQENYAAAERLLREALSAQTTSNRDTWRFHYTQSLLGAVLTRCGRASEAGELLTAGYQGLVTRRASIPFETRQIVDEAKAWLEILKKSDRSQPPDGSHHCS
jgi:tetratricopeptide (TPR) repeat protein